MIKVYESTEMVNTGVDTHRDAAPTPFPLKWRSAYHNRQFQIKFSGYFLLGLMYILLASSDIQGKDQVVDIRSIR